MQSYASVLIAAVAIVLLFIVARSARARYAGKPDGGASGRGRADPGADDELVAVIAAAVSAESGMAPGSFRISGITPSTGLPEAGSGGWSRGFNTPIWGHIERFASQERP